MRNKSIIMGTCVALAAMISLGVISSAAFAADEKIQWADSFEDALKAAAKSGKPLFVDFGTEWCGYCDKMDRETLSDPLIVTLSAKFESARVDADKRKDLKDKYKVSRWPSYLFMDTTGEVIYKTTGFMPTRPFSVKMNTALEMFKVGPEFSQLQTAYKAGEATPTQMARLAHLLRRAGRDAEAAVIIDEALKCIDETNSSYTVLKLDKHILDARSNRPGATDDLDRWVATNSEHSMRWEAQYELGIAQANGDNLVAAAKTLHEVAAEDGKSEFGVMAGYYADIIDGIINKPVSGG